MKPNVIIINERDNVAIVLEDIGAGEEVCLPDGAIIIARSDIPFSHKVAVADIKAGGYVYKYGEVIGAVKETVVRGDWIHIHNLDVEVKVEE
jgi:altronate dehydratase